jgi:hypothetical protein
MGRCAMNEEFIKQFRKPPESRFVEKTHLRLEKKERIQKINQYSTRSLFVLMFMFGLLVTFSSTVGAEVIRVIKEFAGLQFEETSKCPGCTDDVITIEPEFLSLDAARNQFSSPIVLPTYIPQGFERLVDAELYNWGDGISPSLMITWEKRDGDELFGGIQLEIRPCPSNSTSCGLIVGKGALEEIILNGKPAAVIRGAWNHDRTQYDLSGMIAIQWRYDENTVYTLSSEGQPLALDEYIKTAESIP